MSARLPILLNPRRGLPPRASLWVGVILLVAGAAAAWHALTSGQGGPGQPLPASTDALHRIEGLAPSLQGTHPDGQLHAGNARLVLGPGLIRRFDYWLTAHGEKPLQAIRADIQADLAQELDPPSLQRALRLLDAYVAYKTALASLQPEPSGQMDAEALGRQLQAIRAVRARHFSTEETVALFGAEDAEDDHALARLRIHQDTSLSDAARRERLQQLSQQLPPERRAAETEPVLHLSVADAVSAARARGADAAEVRDIRTRMVGADAAERLARLDTEQATWQSRVDAYLAVRQSQPGDAEAYKARQFSPTEQLRLDAYE